MNFAVLGAGAWGTAVAVHLERLGHTVTLVPRRMEHALEIASKRENEDYLKGIPFGDNLQVGFELKPALMEADVVFMACPSKGVRDLCNQITPVLETSVRLKQILILSKGLDLNTFQLPVELAKELIPNVQIGVFSGPSNAMEFAIGKPAALTIGSESCEVDVLLLQKAMSNQSVRVYSSKDVRGVELGGSLKNVYAIAAGIIDGLQLGDNSKAAFLTRSIQEMVRVGVSLGGQAETFYGLSGVGDLIATCMGSWSRNRTFGEKFATGEVQVDQISDQKTVVEGYYAARCFYELCEKEQIEAPILGQVYEVLYKDANPQSALMTLMGRSLKAE